MNDIESYEQLKKQKSALYNYKDYDMIIDYNGESKLSDTDKVIDVLVKEYRHYNFELDMFEEFDDTAVELVVEDKNGSVREESIAFYKPNELYPNDLLENELDNFYRTETDERYFNHLKIDTSINVQQAIDMLEILNKKRKEIGFDYCDESVIIKAILGISGIFDSKNAKPIMLYNEFLGRSDEAPSFSNMLIRTSEEQEVRVSAPVESIIQFPEQEGFDNSDDFREKKQGEIIDINRFRR